MTILDRTSTGILNALSMRLTGRLSCSEQYHIDSRNGTGTCRVIPTDESTRLLLFRLELTQEAELRIDRRGISALLYLREGEVELRWKNAQDTMQPEQICFFGEGVRGTVRFAPGVSVSGFLILLDTERWQRKLKMDAGVSGVKILPISRQTISELQIILHRMQNCPIRDRAALERLYYCGKANELLSICVHSLLMSKRGTPAAKPASDDRERVMRIAEYIRANPTEEIDAAKMEQMALMNRTKLKSVFKALTGVTMTEFRGQIRGERARELLHTTQMSVSEIARQLGFQSASAFSRFFRERYEVSPMQYRKQALN